MKKKIIACSLALMVAAVSVVGAGFIPKEAHGTNDSVVTIEENQVPLVNSGAKVLKPEASGKVTYTGKDVVLDVSNISQGYVMIKYSGKNPKIKVQIARAGGVIYTYNLNARNAYEVFPISEGDGAYSVKVFENVSGTSYSQAFAKNLDVKLDNKFLPFLYPNQYVNFSENSAVVAKAAEIVKGTKNELEKVEKVYNFAVGTFAYDYDKAATVKSGYLPSVDSILQTKTGICFDYAAVMASMLRSQNIPCKLVVGYTGDVYHAWINVYTVDTGWIDGVIFFDGNDWRMMDPTFASTGNKSTDIQKYISNPANYKAKYVY